MKKNSFLATASCIAALLLSSCTTTELIDPSDDFSRVITMGTFLDRPSGGKGGLRAPVMDLDRLKAAGEGFTVLAWNTGSDSWNTYVGGSPASTPNFMDAVDSNTDNVNDNRVTWSTNKWIYSPLKYWPENGDKISFFAYSTSAEAASVSAPGAVVAGQSNANPTVTFTCAESAADQVDLVVGTALDKTGDDRSVKFEFDHVLSRVGFSAKLREEYQGAVVEVTKLKVYYKANKVKKKGVYTFNTTAGQSAITPTNWSLTGTDYMADATPTNGDEIFSGSAILDNDDSDNGGILTATDLCHDANALDTDDDTYLMLIPQTLADGDMYVELEWKVTLPDEVTPSTETATIDLSAVSGGYLPGFQYTYTFVLTLDPVVFDTETTANPWDTTNPNIDVTVVPPTPSPYLGVPGWIPVPEGALGNKLPDGVTNDDDPAYDWLHFMTYNMGATDLTAKEQMAHTPSPTGVTSTDMTVYGGLYQWGRLGDHSLRNSAANTTQISGDIASLNSNTSFIIGNNTWYTGTNPQQLWGGISNQANSDQVPNQIAAPWGHGTNEPGANLRVPSQYEWALLVSTNTGGTNGANDPTNTTDDTHTPNTSGVIPAGNPNIVWFPVAGGKVSDSWSDTQICGFAIYLATDKDAVATTYATNLTDAAAPEPLLFLPAAGWRNSSSSSMGGSGSYGIYWSSTVAGGDNARNMFFYSGNVNAGDNYYRAYGLSLRCLVE